MDFKEKTITSTLKYKGDFLSLYKDNLELPNKSQATREYIDHPGASIILARFENNDTLLIKQFRYPLQKVLLEVPAGKIDHNENPQETAKREFFEETGHHAKTLQFIQSFYPCIGYSNEVMHLYLAETTPSKDENNSNKNTTNKLYGKDPGENIELVKVPYKKALEYVYNKTIVDLKSITSILLCQKYFEDTP